MKTKATTYKLKALSHLNAHSKNQSDVAFIRPSRTLYVTFSLLLPLGEAAQAVDLESGDRAGLCLLYLADIRQVT